MPDEDDREVRAAERAQERQAAAANAQLMQALRASVAETRRREDPLILEPEPENRTVFVGYPYAFPKDDYRGVFSEVGEAYNVAFSFADQELTNVHILVKIETMMRAAAFSLFDITLWNPNVALELGIAYGSRLDYYILFDPTKGNPDVLADLRGIDRIEYASYTELKAHLSKLMGDQFGLQEQEEPPEAGTIVSQLDGLRARIPDLLREEPGQSMGGLASSLGLPIDLAQTLVRPMLGVEIETSGVRSQRYSVLLDGNGPAGS